MCTLLPKLRVANCVYNFSQWEMLSVVHQSTSPSPPQQMTYQLSTSFMFKLVNWVFA